MTKDYKIVVVDDEKGILDSVSMVIRRLGYSCTGFDNPLEAIESIRNEQYDLLILDFLMEPIHGDKVVKMIREFNQDLYILLLTGYKDVAPPLETIKELDIQGYCEKADNLDQLILLIESALKSVDQKRTLSNLQNGLRRILESTPKIYQLQPIGNILEDILAEILPIVNCKNAFIFVDSNINKTEDKKSFFKGLGQFDVSLEEFMKMLSPEFMEKIGLARISKEAVKRSNGVILPLISDSFKTIGVIYLEREGLEQEIDILRIFATQAATSINNVFLHSAVNLKKSELDKTYKELKRRYMDAIQVLRLAVDAKDFYTRGHSDRVAYYSGRIGEAFGLVEKELETLTVAGIFHDIGKVGIPDEILFKTSKLNEAEYAEIKKHPLKGANILSAVSMFKDIVPLVKYHHERIDGKGYPAGLKGDEIPFMARIISVADAFDAMTSDRQYRSKLELSEAKNQLLINSGTQFDAKVVSKFIEVLKDYDSIRDELKNTFFDSSFKA
ncbi:MAG: DUF3369 domain-containing protein [Clostridiaceae bacterium]|nr:DUF3369 domain-containing protein [Clostridiaceae bacterium]